MSKLQFSFDSLRKDKVLNREQTKHISLKDQLRKYRDEKCYTQEFMASQLGMSQSAYYKLENGINKLSFERLELIAEILGKPVNFFLQETSQIPLLKGNSTGNLNSILEEKIAEQQCHIAQLYHQLHAKTSEIIALKQKLGLIDDF